MKTASIFGTVWTLHVLLLNSKIHTFNKQYFYTLIDTIKAVLCKNRRKKNMPSVIITAPENEETF